jgi:hypothetical protein
MTPVLQMAFQPEAERIIVTRVTRATGEKLNDRCCRWLIQPEAERIIVTRVTRAT